MRIIKNMPNQFIKDYTIRNNEIRQAEPFRLYGVPNEYTYTRNITLLFSKSGKKVTAERLLGSPLRSTALD